VEISYDKAKNERNITLRGLSFDLVADLDWDNAVIREDTRKVYGEPRYRVFGYIGERLHVVVYTPREGSIRVISPRKANRKEVEEYGQENQNRCP
jgi:uncharacterized DUF497 family protein